MSRRVHRVLLAMGLSRAPLATLALAGAAFATTSARGAAPPSRDYSGPGAVTPKGPTAPVESPPPVATPPAETPPVATPPVATPPAETPPAETPPAETPPAETPPAETPPAETPPPTKPGPVADPGEEESWDGGFDVVDLTEDKEALAKELEVKTVDVKGDSGVVRGKLKDASTGAPLIGAYVEALGTPYKTKTDLEGNYTLELPPGTYELRIRSDANQPRRISGVVVSKGSDETFNAELVPLAGANMVVAVKAEMNKESEGARLLQRKESVAARDIMSREQIQKSGGGSTAQVARRIVGATLIDGKYLFVRGLGHRYGNTLFDGARVPSPEPDIRTVPLDIFPSGSLSAINVQKTFTPDMPGDFAGGSVQLESREIPRKLLFELNVRAGANTQTTFRDRAFEGGFAGADAFGFGNLPRKLPDVMPEDHPANRNALGDDLRPVWTSKQIERFGEALYTDTRVRRGKLALPNLLGQATLGYGFRPTNEGKLGFLVSAGYRNQRQTLHEHWKFFSVAENPDQPGSYELQRRIDYRGVRTVANAQWSTIGLVKYDIDKNHRVTASAFYSRDADNEVRALTGPAENGDVLTTRIRYVMRSILLTRLGGRHVLPKAKGFTIDWFGAFAQARRDDPSIRDMVYQPDPGAGDWRLSGQGASVMFLDLRDNTGNGAVNFTMPFKQWRQLDGKFKFGAWVEGKRREFVVRRFTYQTVNGIDAPIGTGNLLINKYIGGGLSPAQGGQQPYYVAETTQPFDNYHAQQQVYAAYAMLDLPLVRWFRIAGGARFEANRQALQPYDQFTDMRDAERSSKFANNNVLPSLSLIFPVTEKMNVRLVGTETVARPEFRELAPFLFSDFAGGITVLGNPSLTTAKIWNGDLRWEWFPSAAEVLAVSVFGKYFIDPIERTMAPGTSNPLVSFRNAKFAYNVGVEFEAAKNLEFVSKKLREVTLGFNLAYVFSRVHLRDSCDIADPLCDPDNATDVSTSRVRPLQGQAPIVANAYIDWERKRSGTNLRLLYNGVTRNIAFVGGNHLPDTYVEAIHQLDFVGRQRIYKGLAALLQVQNMMNWPIRWRQGSERAINYQVFPGATIMIGLAYEL
ncbi:MAG: TonB-dependent receptor [Nannocystaceae bacterium]|nr:TonB-dependent receptor [Nannocystaceae bacterium]